MLGPDGNLVLEFMLIERYMLDSIASNSNTPYTCAVDQMPVLQCLDIAAPSTLRGTLLNVGDEVDQIYDILTDASQQMNVSASAVPFGGVRMCDQKRVGDGMISPLDLAVLLFYQFGVSPYDQYPFTPQQVSTVGGGTDVGARCSLSPPLTRTQYIQNYTQDTCYLMTEASWAASGYGRRLSEDDEAAEMSDLNANLYTWAYTDHGTWYRIQLHRPYYVVELQLPGLDGSDSGVPLSNAEAPHIGDADDEPDDTSRAEVRFARHMDDARCAPVISMVSADMALYHQTLGVAQIPTRSSALCGIDLYVWVPDEDRRRLKSDDESSTQCDFSVGAGSVAMDGKFGAVQQHTSHCQSLEAARAMFATSPPAPNAVVVAPPSPPATQVPPPSPQHSSPSSPATSSVDDEDSSTVFMWIAIAAAIVAVVSLVVAAVVCCMRRDGAKALQGSSVPVTTVHIERGNQHASQHERARVRAGLSDAPLRVARPSFQAATTPPPAPTTAIERARRANARARRT